MNLYKLVFVVIVFLFAGCEGKQTTELQPPAEAFLETAAIQPSELQWDDVLEDFDYLVTIIRENYPFLKVNERLNGVNWLEEARQYRQTAPSQGMSRLEFKDWLQALLAKLHNGHARAVASSPEYQSLVSMYANKTGSEPWSRLLSEPAVQAAYDALEMENKADGGSADSDGSSFTVSFIDDKTAYINLPSFSTGLISSHMAALSAFLPTMKEADYLILDIRDNSGGNDRYWQALVERLISEPVKWKYYNLLRGTYIRPFIEAKGMKFENMGAMKELPESVSAGLPQDVLQDFSNFFVGTIPLKPTNSIQFNGKIYLIVGPRVFSASEKFACFAKSTGWATLVGERTGGDGLGTDPVLVKLPNSNLIVKLPLIMGVTAEGVINEEKKTEPDILTDTARNAILLQDQAVQAVLMDISRLKEKQR